MWKYVREVSFARNDTLMFVTVQRGNWSLYVYNITWTPTVSTTLIQTFPTLSNQTWSVNTVNDTFAIMTSWDPGVQVYAITSSSATSSVWSRSALPATRVTSSQYLGECITDSCGRLWEIIYGYGIRIYEQSMTTVLANWTFSTGLSNILLFDTYELYMTDYDANYVYGFNPNLQCTS